jgi:hypothetical protein
LQNGRCCRQPIGAELQWVGPVADPLAGPIEFVLVQFVRGEILQRPPPRTGVETNHGETGFGEAAG